MEMCRGGELFYRLCQRGHYYEQDAARIVYKVVDGVAFLHEKGVVHRDLKPENLLFRTGNRHSVSLHAYSLLFHEFKRRPNLFTSIYIKMMAFAHFLFTLTIHQLMKILKFLLRISA
jgi:serine/threonine protein kinase